MSKHIRHRQNKRQKEVAKLKARLSLLGKRASDYWAGLIMQGQATKRAVMRGNKYLALAQKYLRAFESVCEIAGENPSFVVPEYETDAKNLSPTDENGNYKND